MSNTMGSVIDLVPLIFRETKAATLRRLKIYRRISPVPDYDLLRTDIFYWSLAIFVRVAFHRILGIDDIGGLPFYTVCPFW